jgi:hypothetical protein
MNSAPLAASKIRFGRVVADIPKWARAYREYSTTLTPSTDSLKICSSAADTAVGST